MGKVLVSLPYEGGVATVERKGRRFILAGSTVVDDHRPSRVGIGDGLWIFGGLLPEGATRAVLKTAGETAAGGGAWIAVVDAPALWDDPPVRFETEDGRIVRPSLPADWTREPLPEVGEACPACGATGWERVTPSDETFRGGSGMPGGPITPTPVIVCLRCGHEESEGVWYAAVGDEDEDEPVAHTPQPRPEPPDVPFAYYGVVGGVEEIDGWGSHNGRLCSVTVGNVTTDIEPTDGPREASAGMLMRMLEDDDEAPPGGSTAAMSLWVNARQRLLRDRVGEAEPFATELDVDGVPVPFEGLRRGGAWAAVGLVGPVLLTVGARATPPEQLALRRLNP